jgi:hypothetical protein
MSQEDKVRLFYSRTFVLLVVTALVMFIAVNYRWDNPAPNPSSGQSSGSRDATAPRDAGIDGP